MMNIISIVRLILTLIVAYLFLGEYLGKKYYRIWSVQKIYEKQSNDLQEMFNFTTNTFNEDIFEQTNQKIQSDQLQQKVDQQLFDFSLFQVKKKVNNYIFTFYNLYRIQIRLTDLGYDSFFEFTVVQEKMGSISVLEKVAFKIPEQFEPKPSQNKQNLLNFKFNTKGFNFDVSQFTTPEAQNNNLYNDGYIEEQLFYLSENKSQVTEKDYKKFGSSKTITNFQISLIRADLQLKANLTHVIRHNQCISNRLEKVIRHKCMGGYGNGKIHFNHFMKNSVDEKQGKIYGDWKKETMNLDNSRARTIFVGQWSRDSFLDNLMPTAINNQNFLNFQQHLNLLKSPVQFTLKSIEIDFLGFNKDEYYAKEDKIQKQRWVGMSLYKGFDSKGEPSNNQIAENFFFVNGNVHPIYLMDFEIELRRQKLRKGQTIQFSHVENQLSEKNQRNQSQPNFSLKFSIFNVTEKYQQNLINKRQTYRVNGFWSGWIDQLSLFEQQSLRDHYTSTQEYGYVKFYNITGTLELSQQTY